MELRLVKAEDIEKQKWNSCVHYSTKGNIFGYDWFINNVAKDWEGLVEGDYESVLPLVWKKEQFRSKHIYQPPWARELGLYSVHVLSRGRIKQFLEAIPKEYGRIDLSLNKADLLLEEQNFTISPADNYVLPLQNSYEEVAQQYAPTVNDALTIASNNNLRPSSSLKPERIADFFKKHTVDKNNIKQRYHSSLRIMYNVLHRGWGFATGIENDKRELQAVAFFIYSHNKVMNLIAEATPEGQQNGALILLYELLIRTHAGRQITLDFNTNKSDIALALGGTKENYFQLQRTSKKWSIF